MSPRATRAERLAAVSGLLLGVLAAPVAGQSPPDVEDDVPPVPPGEVAHTTLVHPPYGHTLGIHRARPIHLKLFLDDRTRFDDPQGLAAVKLVADDDPAKKNDDFQLTLFGVNSGRGEILYNSSMQTLAVYGREGGGEGMFRAPHGIAATADGRVYVADTDNRRVVRLRWDPVARSLRWEGEWRAARPFDVAADARGNVYATDRGEGAVRRFVDATAVGPASPVSGDRWPLPEDVVAPLGLAVGDSLEPWYRSRHYRLYLVDRDGGRLRAYDAAGAVVAETTPSTGRFLYLALDHFGNVYATNPAAGLVQKFDRDLAPLEAFRGPGPAEWDLEEPRGIAIWKRFGQVFVAEREGAQYYFVGTDFEVASPLEIHRTLEPEGYAFRLFLTEAASVRATFRDAAGDTLAVVEAGVLEAGARVVAWGPGGWSVPPSEGWIDRVHDAAIEARPTYSSRRRFSRVRVVPVAWNGP